MSRCDPLRARNLAFFTRPGLWKCWPFLPVVRRRPGVEQEELGVVCDLMGSLGVPGRSATVWVTNLFLMPETWELFFELPHEAFDTPEELFSAGWRVD